MAGWARFGFHFARPAISMGYVIRRRARRCCPVAALGQSRGASGRAMTAGVRKASSQVMQPQTDARSTGECNWSAAVLPRWRRGWESKRQNAKRVGRLWEVFALGGVGRNGPWHEIWHNS